MDRTISVSLRGLLVAALVLLGLLCAYLLGGAGDGPGTPARAASPGGDERTLTMIGHGTTTAVPDEVSFTVSVGVTRDDLTEALDVGNATTRSVLKEVEAFGVGREHVQTTGLSMSPVYDYPSSGPPALRGYRVTQKARVTVPDLGKAGKAIAAAVDAGGNDARVSDISLGISDPEGVLGEARDNAVEDATAKAERYADATGQSLGAVITLEEVQPAASREQQYAMEDAQRSTALAATQIRAGEDELQVRVRVVWQFG